MAGYEFVGSLDVTSNTPIVLRPCPSVHGEILEG